MKIIGYVKERAGRFHWERFIDILTVATAVGVAFIIVLALILSAKRDTQVQDQIMELQRLVEVVEGSTETAKQNVEEHRESALRQHCAEATLEVMEDGRSTGFERRLLELACNH